MKRLYKPKNFYRLLGDLMSNASTSPRLAKNERISKDFQERIMMAVTEVNGCRYCSYFHTRVALMAGIDKKEIQQTLAGNFENAPQNQLAALYFAQYYAESEGLPSGEAINCMIAEYGEAKTSAIMAYIRAIMVGNAWGNMLDALRKRLKGIPCENLTLSDELAVIFGPFVMIPSILIKKLYSMLVVKQKIL